MTMTKKERVALEVAQMRRKEAEDRLAEILGNSPTNTFMSTSGLAYQPLLENANINFVLLESGNTIQARIRNGWLEIMGDTRIEILPQTANVIHVRCKEG